ncbi:MAG: hypothetical protein H2054_04180 [Sphingomonas sp.]|uniref:hypothetical protein n=1 Tax=Sphingomonas sp. TaxID=28214 RepID=UPI0018595FCC|nr:hypothetical protein [Sphingomonas sp.]
MADETTIAIASIVSRIPEWVRRDLLSTDAATRARAEDTIAAMVQEAIGVGQR